MNKVRYGSMGTAFFFLLAGIFSMTGCSSPYLYPSQLIAGGQPHLVSDNDCSMEYHKSRRYCREGVTIIILRGSPWELGYARGVLLREEIQAWAKGALSEIERQQAARNLNQNRIKKTVSVLEAAIPQEFKGELEGLAASSGVDYPTLLMLNVWSNVDGGCTSIAVSGSDGKLLRSRNYDWVPIRLLLPPVLSIYQPDNGYGFMSVHAPGIIGVATGMNEKGITFGSHSLPGSRHSGKGMASAMLNRLVVQYAAALDDVEYILKDNPRGMPRLWLVTSQDKARIYEFDGLVFYRVEMEDKSLVLTNHGRKLNLREPSLSSLERFDGAVRLIRDHHGNMDVRQLIELSSNQAISSYGQGSNFMNLHSAVFAPSSLEFWVALDSPPAVAGRWVNFSLKSELLKKGGGFEPSDLVSGD